MKNELITNVVFLSLLHGLIPSHWGPVIAMKRQFSWSFSKTLSIAGLAAFLHVASTVVIGFTFALVGKYVSMLIPIQWISSTILILLGMYFIFKHHKHQHFHMYHQEDISKQKDAIQQIQLLLIGMLFSPCMEITGMYFVGGMVSMRIIIQISLIYMIISLISSLLWLMFFDKLITKLNFHKLEHNSGLLAGWSLIISGILVWII